MLLDSTLPVIRRRTRALSAQLAEGQRLEKARSPRAPSWFEAAAALAARRQRFAELERNEHRAIARSWGQALGTGDIAMAAGEQAEQLRSEQSSSRSARELAA